MFLLIQKMLKYHIKDLFFQTFFFVFLFNNVPITVSTLNPPPRSFPPSASSMEDRDRRVIMLWWGLANEEVISTDL